MNFKKAIDQASKWVEQKPSPKELDPVLVKNVLEGLGFTPLGKVSDHTTFRYYHDSLKQDENYFVTGILKVSLGHAEGSKTVIRQGSVNILLKALKIFIEEQDEERS